jgi:hypothetical protein
MSRLPFALTPPPISEDDVEAGCLTILGLHQYYVIRLHAGVFETLDQKRKITGVKRGTPDYACLHAVHRGFLLEAKRPGGKLSDDQVRQIEILQIQFRLPIVVVYSVDQLCDFLAKHERSP